MIWLWIILAIFLFLLFYPLRVTGDFWYENKQWQGKTIILPLFCLKWPKITLFYSSREEKKKMKKNGEKGKRRTKSKKEKEKSSLREQVSLPDQIPIVLDLLLSAGKGVRKLRVWLHFGYGFDDPAVMGYLTGAIYAALPSFLGDYRKTHWRIRIDPQWGTTETVAFLHTRVTVNLFFLIQAFGLLPSKFYKLLPKKTRRNHECQNIPLNL